MQTAVIAGAQAFIGTCGSLAWLAPMLGVDTVAVYADERFLLSHIFFATHVYRQAGAARFDTLDLRAAMQLDLVTGEEVSARVTRLSVSPLAAVPRRYGGPDVELRSPR